MRRLLASAGLVLVLATPTVSAGVSPEDFARNPDVLRTRISPTGEYLATLRVVDDKRVVAVLTFPDMELKGVMSFPGRNQVLSFRWVNDERLVGSVTRDFGRFEFLSPSGELFGMNADGGRGKHLFGYRAGADTPSATRGAVQQYASATIIDPLRDDPDHVLIQVRDWTAGKSSPVEAVRMNVYSGRLSRRIRAPVPDAQLVTDNDGNVRFAFSNDDEFNTVIHERNPETREWRVFSKVPFGDAGLDPLAIAPDGRIWVNTARDEGPLGLYLMDPKTQELTEVYRHEYVDATPVVEDDDGNVWGVRVDPGLPDIVVLDPDNSEATLREQLRAAFPERFLQVLNGTRDGTLQLIGVTDDDSTPEVYVFDREERNLARLFDSLPWVDDAKLSEMRPIVFRARDGVPVHGYLSMPRDAGDGPAPLVLMPHGGPHGIRDYWGYDPYVQVLTTHGYAVLQVNYRGSGGYGPHFQKLGYLEWAGAMQDDLSDAVHWAIERGVTTAGRVCIHGWSYGGYAAAMSVVREPDLYACSVPAAGVYDHNIQYREADFARHTRWGDNYLDQVIGPTPEERRLASPIAHIKRLKTPLFLVHGEEDARVPVAHAHAFLDALEKAGIDAAYMEKENEGHGFFKEENRVDFFKALLAFLDRHIGPEAKTAEAAPRNSKVSARRPRGQVRTLTTGSS